MTSRRETTDLRSLPLREIGLALVALGSIGLVSVVVAVIVISAAFARLDALTRAAAGPLEGTARTISDAADAFDGFEASLAEAQRSAQSASQLADDTARTLDGLATAMSIQVFGTQPLLPAAEGFRQASDQLGALGGDLAAMSDALGSNIDDVEQTSRNLRQVRNEMDALLAAFGTDDRSARGIGFASLGIYLLLGWLALMALGCLLLGVLVLRR